MPLHVGGRGVWDEHPSSQTPPAETQATENFISLIASEFVTHPPTRLVA